jgi:hypothetical protein
MPTTAVSRDEYAMIETMLGCSIAANMIAFEKLNPKKPETNYGMVHDRLRANAQRASLLLDAGEIARTMLSCASIVPDDTITPAEDTEPPEQDPGPVPGMIEDLAERVSEPDPIERRNGAEQAGVVASTIGLHPDEPEQEIVEQEITQQLEPLLARALAVPSRPYIRGAPKADGSVLVKDNEGNLIAQFFPPVESRLSAGRDKFQAWAEACARNMARICSVQPEIVEFIAKVADKEYQGQIPASVEEEAAHLYTLITGDTAWTTR